MQEMINELNWQDLRLAYCTTNDCDNQLTNHTQTKTEIAYNQRVNFPASCKYKSERFTRLILRISEVITNKMPPTATTLLNAIELNV